MAMDPKEVFEKAEDLKKQILADPSKENIKKILKTIPDEDRESVAAAFAMLTEQKPKKQTRLDEPQTPEVPGVYEALTKIAGDKEPMRFPVESSKQTPEQLMEDAGYGPNGELKKPKKWPEIGIDDLRKMAEKAVPKTPDTNKEEKVAKVAEKTGTPYNGRIL